MEVPAENDGGGFRESEPFNMWGRSNHGDAEDQRGQSLRAWHPDRPNGSQPLGAVGPRKERSPEASESRRLGRRCAIQARASGGTIESTRAWQTSEVSRSRPCVHVLPEEDSAVLGCSCIPLTGLLPLGSPENWGANIGEWSP